MSSTDLKLFDMAGIKKNAFLDRWEFIWGGSSYSSDAGTTTVESSRCSADDNNDDPNKRSIHNNASTKSDDHASNLDEIDLTALRIGNEAPVTVGNKSAGGKKKRRKKPAATTTAANSGKPSARSVSWGDVEQILFTRLVSYDGIPTKGGYPLGLGHVVERTTCTIDQLYYSQQCQLRDRAEQCGIKSVVLVETSPPDLTLRDVHIEIGKDNNAVKSKKTKGRSRSNSTTSAGSDSHAAVVISSLATTTTTTLSKIDASRPLETRQFDYKSSTNPLFYSLDEDKRIHILTAATDPHHETTSSSSSSRATRSYSLGMEQSSTSNVFTEINNEIRVIKSMRGESGCSCKHTKVDKLSVSKLKSELLNNCCHLSTVQQLSRDDIDKLTKPELMNKVKETLRYCVMCVDNDCACVQQGVPCNSQLCGCLRSGYHPGESQSCANPEGRDLYDLKRVQEYRRDFLARHQADVEDKSTLL